MEKFREEVAILFHSTFATKVGKVEDNAVKKSTFKGFMFNQACTVHLKKHRWT